MYLHNHARIPHTKDFYREKDCATCKLRNRYYFLRYDIIIWCWYRKLRIREILHLE